MRSPRFNLYDLVEIAVHRIVGNLGGTDRKGDQGPIIKIRRRSILGIFRKKFVYTVAFRGSERGEFEEKELKLVGRAVKGL